MNVLKIALLGTAALAAVSVSARADDLSDLKAQIEALNGRIASLESNPSVPAGYQLLSISEGEAIIVPGDVDAAKDAKINGTKATNIGIMPTADVPASANIQWTGNIRAALVYRDVDNAVGVDRETLDVRTRAFLRVVGTTDTAVGEVGVRVSMLSASLGTGRINRGNRAVSTDGYWGWWAITPELTLGGGVDGSLSNSNNAYDNRCTCMFTDTGAPIRMVGSDPSQIRLSYASGPISFGIAVEDNNNIGKKSALGVAGELRYNGDMLGFDVNAGYTADARAFADDNWTVNIGANMALGDIANLGLALGVGEDAFVAGNADKYMKASGFLGFTLSDSVSAELGATYTNYRAPNADEFTVGAALYYTPVDQLTLGLEASYSEVDNTSEAMTVAAVSVYRF